MEKQALAISFSFERETKGAVRYSEQHAVDVEPKVGVLYVRKAALATLGRWSVDQPYPLDLHVVVEGADDATD
jgi:hypothetical protein